jgi:hypothetical protein
VKGRTAIRRPGLKSNSGLLVIRAVDPGKTGVSTVLQDQKRNMASTRNTENTGMRAGMPFDVILGCT